MTQLENLRIVLTSRPVGEPTESNFQVEKQKLPPLNDGQVLIKTLYLSMDPYMRETSTGFMAKYALFSFDAK